VHWVAGGHLTASQTFAGRGGRDVGFVRYPGVSLLPDDGTNVLLAHATGLLRLGPDGKLAERWRVEGGEALAGHVPRADGGEDLLVRRQLKGEKPSYSWRSMAANGTPIGTRAITNEEAAALLNALPDAWYLENGQAPLGAAVNGRLIIRTGTTERFFIADTHQPMFALHPDGLAPEALDDGTTRPHFQDGRGRLYRYDRDAGQLYKVERGGPRVPFGKPLPPELTASAVTSTPDGTVYLATSSGARTTLSQRIWRITADATELVGGREQLALGPTEATPLRPAGLLLVGPTELWAGDRELGRILRIRHGQPLEALYGDPLGPAPAAGALAAGARLDATGLARDGDGRLLFVHEGKTIWRVDAGGRLELLFTSPLIEGQWYGDTLHQLAVSKDGVIHVFGDHAVADPYRTVGRVLRLDGKGGAQALDVGGEDVVGLGIGPDGALRVARQTSGAGNQPDTVLMAIGADGRAAEAGRIALGQPAHLLALDGAGRWWFETAVPDQTVHRLVRYDLATQSITPVAGFGAPAFGGDTPDDGLALPSDLAFGPAGDVFVVDQRLIKRIPPQAR